MTRTTMFRAIAAAAGVGLALTATACSTDDDSSTTAASSATTAASAATAPQQKYDTEGRPALPAVPAAVSPTVTCDYPMSPRQASRPVETPATTNVSTEGVTEVTLATTQGTIGMTLDRAAAPCTVNSFASLAEQGFFDDTDCHRIVTSGSLQVLQCGDPTAQGTGGPGYSYANEYPTTVYEENDPAAQEAMIYPRGTVAMANSGPGGTNGSQFFLVYEDSLLPPQYTVFGTISEEGLATIEKVAEGGDDGSMSAGGGKPNTPITIETATVA